MILGNKSILKHASGTVGNLVFRQYNGKTIVCLRPERYSMPMDEESISRRGKFKMASLVAHCINKIPHAKKLWAEEAGYRKSVIGTIFKSVYPYVLHDDVGDNISVYPFSNFNINNENIKTGKSCVTLLLDSKTFYGLPGNTEYIQAAGLVVLRDRISVNVADIKLLPFEGPCLRFDKSKPAELNIFIPGSQEANILDNWKHLTYYDSYDSHTFFIAFASLDGNKMVVSGSDTFNFRPR